MMTLTAPVLPRGIMQDFERRVSNLPQVDLPLSHHFADGLYARTIEMPAGTIATGKIHMAGHLNILVKGKVEVFTDHGLEVVSAPHVFNSRPGTKKMVHILEDAVWTTVHATEETDVDTLEATLTAPAYDETGYIFARGEPCLS